MEKVKLTDICRPKQWKTISTAQLKESGYPVYGANGKIGFYNEYTHEFPTLLITCRGATCGTVNISEPNSYVNGNAMALDNLSKDYDLKFLYHYFGQRGFNDVISGSAQPQITRENLSKVEVPKINLATQQRIAAILDQADAIIQNNRAIVQKYDALTQSLFLDMFGDPVKNEKGWEKKNGVEYSNKISVGVVIKPASNYVDEGVIALRSLNVKPNKIDLTDLVFFSKEAHNNELSKSKLNKGDVVIIRTGSTGTAAIIPEELDNINCIDLIIVKPNLKFINPKYLVYFFNSERGKNLVSGHEVGGIQKHFNIGSIKKIEIPTPPIELQNQFAERVAMIEAQKQQAQLELAKSEELFNSLLQRAFKGELN